MPTSSSLAEFAQDPPAYLPGAPGSHDFDEPRFFLRVSGDGTWATVCRLRGEARPIFDRVRHEAPQARVTWITDGSAEAELRSLGCRDQDAPLSSYITALATDEAPPRVDRVEVQRLTTYEAFLTGLGVSARGWGRPEPADPERTWAGRRGRPGGEWLAFVDGEPVAYAGAIAGPRGLFLTGGVTLPEARGRGAYRALVRARWDEAVRRGTPALAVHAEEPSRRVLERIGFTRVGPVVELVSGPS